jgi:hypothetical protein
MTTRCWLAGFSDRPCDGRLVRAHLISQQVLRRDVWSRRSLMRWSIPGFPDRFDDLVWDPAVWVWACGGPHGNAGHHGMLDHQGIGPIRIPRAAIPERTERFAELVGLGWFLDRTYGRMGE